MLSREGNASNQQKSYSARAAHFFCTFLCRCFARLHRETSTNFLVTRFLRKCRTCSRSLFFTAAHFHLALVAAGISHFVTTPTKFSCCSSNFLGWVGLLTHGAPLTKRARAPLINENVDDKNARRQTHAPLSKEIKFYYKKGTSDKLIALFTRDTNFELIVVICLVFRFLPYFKHDVKIVCLVAFHRTRKKGRFNVLCF